MSQYHYSANMLDGGFRSETFGNTERFRRVDDLEQRVFVGRYERESGLAWKALIGRLMQLK